MTIRERLEQIAYAPVKENDFIVQKNPDKFFMDMCIKAYNLGLEVAKDNVEMICENEKDYPCSECEYHYIDGKSILKLKL